jgi:hypothetical protein
MNRCFQPVGGFPSVPSPGLLRDQVHPLRSLASPTKYVAACHLPDHECRAPSLGSLPPSRHKRMKSTNRQVSHTRLRSALDVSHTLDGLTPPHTLRACFIPLPRPGFALQGFSSLPSRLASSTSRALMLFGELHLTASCPATASSTHFTFRALVRAAIRCDEQMV